MARDETGLLAIQPEESPVWSVRNINRFLNFDENNIWYSNSSLELKYKSNSSESGIIANLKQLPEFLFYQGKVKYEIDGRIFTFYDSTLFRANANRYEIINPVSIFHRFRLKRFQFTGSLSLIRQQAHFKTPKGLAIYGGYLYLHWNADEKMDYHLLAKALTGYHFANFTIETGFLNWPVIQIGDTDFEFVYNPKTTPLLQSLYRFNHSELGFSMCGASFTSSLAHEFQPCLLGKLWQIKSQISFRSSYGDFLFRKLHLHFEVPYSDAISLSFSYNKVWADVPLNNRQAFHNWQSSVAIDEENYQIDSTFPQQSFSVNLTFSFRKQNKTWPLRVLNTTLDQHNFFSIKSNVYTEHPIGTIEILNESEESVAAQLVITSTSGSVFYRSPEIDIASKSRHKQSLHLMFQEKYIKNRSSKEQLIISAIVENQSRIIDYLPITVFDQHGWNGQIEEIKYFIEPNNPAVQGFAPPLYQNIIANLQLPLETPTQKLNILKSFLSELGKDLAYITDPVPEPNVQVDFVQFYEETLKKGGGDCEDLTVFLASSLMAVGYDVALVDLRPQKMRLNDKFSGEYENQGHVFLIVNTGLSVNSICELELTEFQIISRRSRLGGTTLWLPIETTRISNGFDDAFKAGTWLYYKKVIESEGVIKGLVFVYDL